MGSFRYKAKDGQGATLTGSINAKNRNEAIGELRKKNLSVYDIQRELAAASHPISINALSVLLREEGFARLPRRRDDERPQTIKPEAAAVADVRMLDLAPRSFRTRLAGLFLFVPLMKSIDLPRVLSPLDLPGSEMIPCEQAVRAMLALKLIGKERKSLAWPASLGRC